MNKDLHIYINNEEVVCDKNITINEEMLSTSSTILKNCYPKSWETTKDYISNFYFPKDYSKCKIFNEIYNPEIPGSTVSGSNLSINYDNTLNYEIEELKGNTTQNGTPTPSSPVSINSVTGLQKVNVCGKNLFDGNMELGNFDSSGVINSSTTRKYSVNYIRVNPSTTYVSNKQINRVCFYDINKNFISRSSDYNIYIISIPSNAYYIRFDISTDIATNEIQIEKGSTASTFETYTGNSYEINLGKNLLDVSQCINGYINSNGDWSGGNNNLLTSFIPVVPGSDYTISLNTQFSNIGYALYNASKTYISRENNFNKQTLTISIPNDTFYIKVWFNYSGYTTMTPEYILQYEPMIEKGSTATSYSEYFTPIELNKINDYQDYIYKNNGTWYKMPNVLKIESYNGETITTDYKSTTGGLDTGATIYYGNDNPTPIEITNTDLINQLESIRLLKGINNISVISPNEFGLLQIHYNYKEAYTTEDLIFCGLVKNTGNISLNPREPHYVDLQLLDFKDLLSTGETLNYVITGKTIVETIEQVVESISDYGFIVGNINILRPDDIINAYSTLNKTAYDVFQYIADITQSRWTTRVVDENTIAIDFYDPTLMPQADAIEYTKEYFEENDIENMTFNYSTNDYRNKQIMTSNEVYANITQTETLISNGYQDSYMAQNKIGIITSITVNGTPATFATKSEEELGVSADFIYQPGEMTFNAKTTYSAGTSIVITYYPIVKGREIVLNNEETSRIQSQINRKGTISRYENRNDTTSSQELIKIGQSYIKYKGKAEISLKIVSSNNLFNVGQIVEFNAPLEELSTEYMVKSKTIEIITTIDKIFYTFELSSNFNSENAINYFDNQRAKTQGNIGEGETISRAIDLEDTAVIKFYDTSIEEIEVGTITSLDFSLDSVLI